MGYIVKSFIFCVSVINIVSTYKNELEFLELKKHILITDISTPATYARYSSSPSGSIFDMAPYTSNFGRTRLKMRTPIKGLFQPKFVHGVFGSLLAGIQVNDMILNRKIMNGNARLKKQ